jgi:hydroxymethylglutaryl-CoA synthase
MVGIVGYGAYVPAYRIKASTIADQWGDDIVAIERGLLMKEKTVPGKDEDTITISVAAAKNAVKRAGIDPQKIGLHWLRISSLCSKAIRHSPC